MIILAARILLLLLLPLISFASQWTGTVVGVSDGDTLTVLNAHKQRIKIRLMEIDAPETNQAFGTRSKWSLSGICFLRTTTVIDFGTDKYNRTLGRVFCNGVDANAEQVKRGMAWAYRQYLKDPSILELEKSAKSARIGLWADKNPIPPWVFRHSGQSIKSARTHNQRPIKANISCGNKTTCKQMLSCTEAMYYFKSCGLKRLDGDHDGVPCESLCR